jgi:uncharacterized protein YcbK (DUF882 family)
MRTVAFMIGALALYIAHVGARATAQSQDDTAAEAAQAAPPPACLAEPVVLKRFGVPEPLVVSLTDCEQRANLAALPLVSALALPAAKSGDQAPPAAVSTTTEVTPDSTEATADATDAAQPLNPELLVRLQRLASRFPDRAIEIVSGYRTRARAGSRHRSGDALDVRIEGVDNEELSIFARTLEATGVGYYPNSTFVHVDVRAASAYWVDRSGPGEKADYVRGAAADASAPGPEPVRAGTSTDAERAAITAQVERALNDALDDAHGPELPVADAPPSRNPAVSASEAAPTAETVVETTEVAQEPAAAPLPVGSASTPGGDAAPPPSEAPVDPAELEAELKSLLDRALVVMQQANAAG